MSTINLLTQPTSVHRSGTTSERTPSPDVNSAAVRRRGVRIVRVATWGTFEATSIVLQFVGFMIVLLAQGIAAVGRRALGADDR